MNGFFGIAPSRSCFPFLLLIPLLLGTAACEDSFIDPFDNEDRYYTVYGFLDQMKNFEPGAVQTLRIIPITRFPERIDSPAHPQADLDAVVTTTNLNTGQTRRWAHTLEPLSDGTYAHIFRAALFVQAGHTYRLSVARSDGITATAETTVPAPSSIQATLAAPRVDPASGDVTQDVLLSGTPALWDILVIYRVGNDFGATPYPLPYGRVGTPTDDDHWRFTVNISNDRRRLSNLLRIPVSAVEFPAMGLEIRLLDGRWVPPEGSFDPEVLAQPGALSNVENGYGFWGSIGLYQHDWRISNELRNLLGF